MSELKDIVDGFNAGYVIRKEKPLLYEQLNHAINDVDLPFFESFIKGGEELTTEQLKQLMSKDSISIDKTKSLDKISPSKDLTEPDMDI